MTFWKISSVHTFFKISNYKCLWILVKQISYYFYYSGLKYVSIILKKIRKNMFDYESLNLDNNIIFYSIFIVNYFYVRHFKCLNVYNETKYYICIYYLRQKNIFLTKRFCQNLISNLAEIIFEWCLAPFSCLRTRGLGKV